MHLATIMCAMITVSSCKKKKVNRLAVNTVKDLSGRFNDTDSRFIAQSIVEQMLNECYDLKIASRDERILAVGEVRNLSHEHINCSTFMNDIERNLINSGRCLVVANKSIREAIQEEFVEFEDSLSPLDQLEKQRNCAKKLGVNRMIFSSITSIVDKDGKKSVRFYQFDIKLVDVNTNEVVWMGTKKIKKFIQD